MTPPKLGLVRPSEERARSKAAAKIAEGEDDARVVVGCTRRERDAVKMRALGLGMTVRDYVRGLWRKDGVE
jgi:hypothetical protein